MLSCSHKSANLWGWRAGRVVRHWVCWHDNAGCSVREQDTPHAGLSLRTDTGALGPRITSVEDTHTITRRLPA